MNHLIISHKNCNDGWCAAAIVKSVYPYADVIFCNYSDPIPDDIDNKKIIMVDFSFKAHDMEQIISKAKSVLVIDHHKSAEKELAKVKVPEDAKYKAIFDIQECGSSLAWKYYYPAAPMPQVVAWVKDRDLWQWELEHTRRFSAGVQVWAETLDDWKVLLSGAYVDDVLNVGTAIVAYQDKLIDRVRIDNVRKIEIQGHIVPIVTCTHLISETLNKLAQGQPFAVGYWETKDGIVYSFRASEESTVDVSEIAESFGGGGHAKASGVMIPWGGKHIVYL